jgi:hypothetical protein
MIVELTFDTPAEEIEVLESLKALGITTKEQVQVLLGKHLVEFLRTPSMRRRVVQSLTEKA